MTVWVRLAALLLLCVWGPAFGAQTLLSPLPIQHFTDNDGNLCAGCKLFTYQAGTTTKQNTYTDSGGGTPNTNPVVMNARGEAPVWLTPNQSYKFVLAPSTDSDPPTNPYWSVDNIQTSTLGTSQIYTGSGTQPAMTANVAYWTAVSPSAALVIPFPANPSDNDCRSFVNASNQLVFPLQLNGNGHNIGSDTTAVLFGNGAATFCYLASTGYWIQSL